MADYYRNLIPENIIEEVGGVNYIEDWVSIIGYKDLYMVSTFGRIRSIRENVVMRQYMNEKGYLTIGLQKNRSRRKFKVHRLVGFAFIPNYDNKPEINHDDFDKTNNFYKNLEWVTQKENAVHAQIGGRRPIRIKREKVGEFPIRCKKVVDTSTGVVYGTVFHLAEELGVTPKHIRKKLSGELRNDTPYVWVEGQYTLFYQKRYLRDLARYHELKNKIYGLLPS